MKHGPTNIRCSAFSLTDLLVVIAVIGLFLVFLLPALAASKRKSAQIGCVNYLAEDFLGFKIWEGDHGNQFPFAKSITNGGTMELAQNGDLVSTFQKASKQLASPNILICPVDLRRPATSWAALTKTNISYFLNIDANENYPDMMFMGDRNIIGGTQLTNGLTVFKPTDSVKWGSDMHNRVGNVSLTDGSVAQMVSSSLAAEFTNGSTRLAIP